MKKRSLKIVKQLITPFLPLAFLRRRLLWTCTAPSLACLRARLCRSSLCCTAGCTNLVPKLFSAAGQAGLRPSVSCVLGSCTQLLLSWRSFVARFILWLNKPRLVALVFALQGILLSFRCLWGTQACRHPSPSQTQYHNLLLQGCQDSQPIYLDSWYLLWCWYMPVRSQICSQLLR